MNLLQREEGFGRRGRRARAETSLGWLLDGDESKLSADQRQIRQDLKEMVEKRKG